MKLYMCHYIASKGFHIICNNETYTLICLVKSFPLVACYVHSTQMIVVQTLMRIYIIDGLSFAFANLYQIAPMIHNMTFILHHLP